ncbi:MAG: enolase C-terminal domain-like protein [Pseudomonas sp.]|uniref:enolase C-terminal domain-like protein n=1 Tax=Pseudomonas abieticivorans TaxID=2931382 RepID=UPI0020BED7EC|nr:enolase C-terminal domain-like protein [Pseudomonas sp. PIA16]MDE1167421.1 enolase C-terminal domain-like protein [Pseudomonas sp.]
MTTPTITGLRSRAVNVPLTYPIHTAVGTVATAPLVLLDLSTDAGVTGHAYLFAYTPLALKPLKLMIDELAPWVVGQPLAPQALEQALSKRFCLLGFTGLVRMAAAGLDMAAWDALAKANNLPLVKLLGGELRPINSYDSHSLDGERLATERASHAAEAGFKAVKTKIGYATLAEDLRVVRSMRAAVGENFDIMVDYNQSLGVPEAIRRGQALQDEGVTWIEEPTLQHDYAGHARIRSALRVPIQIGENWFGPEEMFKALNAGACDLAMPDLMKIGGVTGWQRASALAQQFGLPVSSHLFQEFSAHLLAVTPTADWLERLDIAGAVIEPTLAFDNGHARIPDLPGAGIIWREDQIAKYSI